MSNILSFPSNPSDSLPIDKAPLSEQVSFMADDLKKHADNYSDVFILTVDKNGMMGYRTTPTSSPELLWTIEKFKVYWLEDN